MNISFSKSILLTKLLVSFSMVSIILINIFSKFFINSYLNYKYLSSKLIPFSITFYLCSIIGFIILISLYKLLSNLEKDEIFTNYNVSILRIISWLCFIIGAICFISSFYYFSWSIIMIASILVCLLTRIIKNIFEKAILIKEENDYTV